MARVLPALLAATVALSLGCLETRAARGRDALRLVVQLHREICRTEVREAWAFHARPEAAQAARLAFWPRSRVGDTDGLRVERDLLDSYLALRRSGPDSALYGRVQQYLLGRAERDRREMAALDRINAAGGTPLEILVRQGDRRICQEEYDLTRASLARLEALGR